MASALFPAVFVLCGGLVAFPVSAQQQQAASDVFKAVIGKWEISHANRDRACAITIRSDPSGNVFKLGLDKACAVQMPELKGVVAWTIGGFDLVRLLDSRGRPVLEFVEVEGGTYEAQRPGEGIYFMENAATAARPLALTADQMAGDWGVVRGPGAVCTITLTRTAADANSFALKLKTGCDALVTRFVPATWYMDRGELVLKSKGGRFWRFAESDPQNWQRVPEGLEPITLVRQ